MISPDALEALARLAEFAFVGRVILSLCPPGLPGRHGIRELPATWAASHLLGSSALALEASAAELLGLRPPPLALVTPWLLVAFERWITLPGAMVPRHEPLGEKPGTLARVLQVAGPIVVLVAAREAPAEATADALALLAVASFALATSRRSPTLRALVVLVLAAALAATIVHAGIETMRLALGTGAGACFASVWLRRGDRRAALLAVVAFAGCGLLGIRESLFGAAGLFALWVHTPEPSKRWILARSLVALALGAAAGHDPLDPVLPFAHEGGALTPMTGAVLLVVSLAVWRRKRLVDARLRSDADPTGPVAPVDSTRVEREAVRDVVLLCLFPLAARGELSSIGDLAPALLPLAPMVVLELGLLLAPAERTLGTAASGAESARR